MSPKKKLFSRTDRIAFIGAGKMAEAIIVGLVKSKKVLPQQVIISDIKSERLSFLKETLKVNIAKDNQKAINDSSVVVLAVKPQNFPGTLDRLNFSKTKIIISIAAGITINYLENKIPDKSIIRVMPNNPALVQKGITAIAAGIRAKSEDVDIAKMIFQTVGEVVEVGENLLDAVTGLSGSGPAFVYLMAEAMVEAGETLGINKSIAEKLAIQTILGSAETLRKTQKPAYELRGMVTSPGGTTKAGLDVLEIKGFKQAVIDAVAAAARRAKELSS